MGCHFEIAIEVAMNMLACSSQDVPASKADVGMAGSRIGIGNIPGCPRSHLNFSQA
jgi:hypothetical protein